MAEKIEKLENSEKITKNIQQHFVAQEVAVVMASSTRDFLDKIQNLLNLEISGDFVRNSNNFKDVSDSNKKQPTTEFLKLVANNLGLAPENHMNYIEKWSKNLGGFFCGTVEQVHVLVESTCWKKTELEEIPAQNNMVKAEIEKMLYRK